MADEHPISEEVLAMRRLLASWLANPASQPKSLINWLQGYDLPVSESGEEPYVWILRGLPLNGGRLEARRKLAQRVAAVLAGRPDVNMVGRRPEQVLYNLLMLAAGLARPEELADPLYEIYERSALGGTYVGLDLRDVLRSALVENQLDNRLEREWFAILEGGREARLPGGPFEGYRGILLMPASPDERGRPSLDAVGRALKLMAHHLEDRHDRRPQFRKLLNRVLEAYGESSLLDRELIGEADRKEWPDWAVECLPSLCLFNPKNGSFLIWHYILACLPKSHSYSVTRSLCRGHVLEASLAENSAKLVRDISATFEENRKGNPYASSSASANTVLDAVLRLLDENRGGELLEPLDVLRQRLIEAIDGPNMRRLGDALEKLACSQKDEKNRSSAFLIYLTPAISVFSGWEWREILAEPTLQDRLPRWATECLNSVASPH